jgi:hypothetical protein
MPCEKVASDLFAAARGINIGTIFMGPENILEVSR